MLVCFCFLFSFFSSFLPARCSVFLFSFFFYSFCVGLFLFLLFVVWTSRSKIDSSLFLVCLSDRLRGNPVRNHIMTDTSAFRHQIANVIYSYAYTHAYTCRKNHDTIIKQTSEDFFNKYTSHFIVTFVCERELRTEHNCNILTPTLMAVSVVSFSFSRAAQPEAQGLSFLLCAGFLYCILSATSFWSPTPQGPKGPLRRAFSTTSCLLTRLISSSNCNSNWSLFLSWPSYIIVQRPLNRLPDLWNDMFNRHQAEITVMQFTCHSLPVHQSMSVPW